MNWISVNDRLSEHDSSYLIYAPSADPERPFTRIAWYNPSFRWDLWPQAWINAITHWMEVPGPPSK